MKRLIYSAFFVLFLHTFLSAQSTDWGAFHNLMDKTWEAEGKWGNGSKFKQEVQFSFDLNQQIIVAESKGFTDQAQTQFGNRNHGIRKYDPKQEKFVFWEFDVFGGVTQGEVILEDKNIIYQYQYGTTMVTDMWQFVNDSTYQFIVGNYEDGSWKQKYLETTFQEKKKDSLLNLIKDKLLGTWTSKAWDGTLEENWTYKNDRIEQTAIYQENGAILYEAQNFMEVKGGTLLISTVIKDGTPKIFRATTISADTIIFENKDYKNPSKVTYFFLANAFHRTIEGIENGAKSTYTFKFNKKDN